MSREEEEKRLEYYLSYHYVLRKFCKEIKPKYFLSIHTFNGELYGNGIDVGLFYNR